MYGVLALNGWQAFKAKHFSDRVGVWDQVFELGRKVDAGLADYDELIRFTAEQTGESEATVRYQLEHTLPNDELLDYIRSTLKPHYKIAILSNASSDIAHHVFSPEQLELFDAIVFSHHVGLTKPQQGMYEAAASKLGVEPAECVFVDDQERHTTGAREAGMRAIVYSDVTAFKRELAQLV